MAMPAESRESHLSMSSLLGGLLGIFFLLYNLWSFADHYRLIETGATIQARVTRSSVERRKGGISYKIDYAFDLAGKSYEGAGALSQHTFSLLRIGGPVEIRYASVNPSISEPAEMSHDRTSLFLHGVIGLPVSLFILFAAFRKERHAPGQDPGVPPAVVEMPPSVRGIAFTLYPVTNMKRARKFYEEDIGLRVSTNLRGEWIEYHLRDNCFAITSLTGGVRPSDNSGGSVALEVYNLDAFVKTLRLKGVRIKVEPVSTNVCRMAVVIDPEGNALTLHERLG